MSDLGPAPTHVYSDNWSGRLTDYSWQGQGVCATSDPDLFIPPDQAGIGVHTSRTAKKICANCPVKVPCEAYGLETREKHGVWNTSARDRAKIWAKWDEIVNNTENGTSADAMQEAA